jgi:hypothetical protein
MTKRRSFSDKFEATVALEALRGDKTAEAMSPTERKAMIRKDHADLSLTKQCQLLKISRSSRGGRGISDH